MNIKPCLGWVAWGSAKSIKNNGAILENEIVKDGKTVQRYWIEIK